MADEHKHTESPLDQEDQEIGAKIAEDPEALFAVLPHYYRGEVSQANNTQDRMDKTTNWAITVMAAILSIVFSRLEMPAYLLLIGILVLSMFLWFEVRRYRFYDVHRARMRFFEENVFANALQPVGVEHSNWREELSNDLRQQMFKVDTVEALSRRIRRIYGLLFTVIGVSWVAKVTLFTPEPQWTEAAELPGIQGEVVALMLGIFYICILFIAYWPMNREAKGEIYGDKSGEWKDE